MESKEKPKSQQYQTAVEKWRKKKHKRVICETHGVVFAMVSTLKSSDGVLCLILVVSRKRG